MYFLVGMKAKLLEAFLEYFALPSKDTDPPVLTKMCRTGWEVDM